VHKNKKKFKEKNEKKRKKAWNKQRYSQQQIESAEFLFP